MQTQEQSTANRVLFTEEMRESGYTILFPSMLPIHFSLISRIMENYGYHMVMLENESRNVVECGLKYVHNDTCYPALLVIGQFIDALQSGRYDPHRTALMLSQTGGGCRASNYIALLRKALEKAGFGYVPVISLNFSGLEDNPGFRLTAPMLLRLAFGILYGDLLMCLRNQCRPYELHEGDTVRLTEEWTRRIADEMSHAKLLHYGSVRKNYRAIVRDYAAIERSDVQKPRVGVVGEIFVKFSPLGNNHLEDFLLSEGAEVVMPGLLDFCLYWVKNNLVDHQLYGMHRGGYLLYRAAYRLLKKLQRDMIREIQRAGNLRPPFQFDHAVELAQKIINLGAKMGEGWLLPAEMLELIDSGVNNIVCAQPFGCLPNHIMGKGMMKPLKEAYPNVNIVAVDYDPGASRVNQENRIKLMLSNTQKQA